jgi:GntR family transcriptional regulator / MocR family aminotransferase
VKTASGQLLASLIAVDRQAAKLLHQQICDGIRRAILNGVLRSGVRLPASRTLALELGVSRLPVLAAFDQLRHEGYLMTRAGSGTYVAQVASDRPRPFTTHRRSAGNRLVAERASLTRTIAPHASGTEILNIVPPPITADAEAVVPFRVSTPALDEFPRERWARLVARHARQLSPQHMMYGATAGVSRTRNAIAEHLRVARAVKCHPDQILIVSGSQAALRLCAAVLLAPNDFVAIENPGYPGAQAAFRAAAAQMVTVPVDAHGLVVPLLDSRAQPVRAVYVTPAHQYPLGVTLSAERRVELLAWAARNDAWVIEDDYDSEFRYVSRPLGALQGQDACERVVCIGSFSKVMFPAIRMGYLVVPDSLIDAFRMARDAFDIFSPTLYQLALADFIEDGSFTRHLRRMRGIYRSRRNALLAALRRDCRGLLDVHNADAGLHLTVTCMTGVDDAEVVRDLESRGLTATALSTCYLGDAQLSGLLLGFGGCAEAELESAVRVLGAAIRRQLVL